MQIATDRRGPACAWCRQEGILVDQYCLVEHVVTRRFVCISCSAARKEADILLDEQIKREVEQGEHEVAGRESVRPSRRTWLDERKPGPQPGPQPGLQLGSAGKDDDGRSG